MKKKIRYIELFCGVGGFRLGLDKNGYECVFSSDNNSFAQKTYEQNFGQTPYGDITKIKESDIPDHELLTAGFPCQPFSISGKKYGFEDTRGTLFFDICRIIKKKKPKVIILENVKHFINHNKKNTLRVVIKSLVDLGYYVNYKVLKLTNFGLPQNRERVIIIGSKYKEFDFNQITYNKAPPLKKFLQKSGQFTILKKSEYTLLNDGVWKQNKDSGLIFIGYRNKEGFKKGIRNNTEHLSRVHRQPNRIYSSEGYHPTRPSQESSGRFFVYLPDRDIVRKLTIDECYAIMGFPADFKKPCSTGQQYRQIGNSVGVNMVSELAQQLIRQGMFDVKNKISKRNSTRTIPTIIDGQMEI